jgi:plasmid stabilization system protein ParE
MAKRKVIWSSRAKLDLFEILDFYLKRNGTVTYSKKLNSKIRKAVKLLEKHSELGIQTDVQSVRNLIVGDYSIFYEIQSATIEIITIWGNQQDPANIDIQP